MKFLGQISDGRDNNLNLIRMLAACGVLVSHAWPIALGPETIEPLVTQTGMSLGGICVYIFFVISGFLITASFVRTRSLTDFIVGRALRLFPGLIVSLLIVAFLIGPMVTELPPDAYFSDPRTWSFLARNSTLLYPQYTLPGVFENNPYPTVEGSIWTLIHEALCYVAVFLVGIAGVFARPRLAAVILTLFIVFAFVAEHSDYVAHKRLGSFLKLSSHFAIGMLAFVLRNVIPMHLGIVLGLFVVSFLTFGTFFYKPIFSLSLAYATMWISFVPNGSIKKYNKIGDYSYGIYVYAFPAQGLAIWLSGPMEPLENIAWALPLTLLPSIISWHMIEQPALNCRHGLSKWINHQILLFEPWRRTPP